MTPASSPEALTAAERAYALVESEPLRAHALAEEAVARARRHREWEGLVAALHALGHARYRLGDARAVRTMRAAVQTAERHGYGTQAAMARRNVALYLAYQGKFGPAFVEIDAGVRGPHRYRPGSDRGVSDRRVRARRARPRRDR